MKMNYRFYALLVAFCFVAWSCSEEDNLAPEGEWELSSPQATLGATNFVLDETTPNQEIEFTWDAAISSEGFQVYYVVVVDSGGSSTFESPILRIPADDSGKALSASITQADLDEALSKAGFPANTTSTISFAIEARSLDKTAYDVVEVSVTRFATEILPTQLFLSGTATEKGTAISQAIPLKRLNQADGSPSNQYEIYTELKAGNTFQLYSDQQLPAHQYGGENGNLMKSSTPITVEDDGVYRISFNLDDMTYSLLAIEKWSVVGSPIVNAWNGDEPLDYQGNGIWQASINLVGTGGFLFRANGDWTYVIKLVKGTSNQVVMESDAASQGLEFEDIPSDQLGTFIFTLDLSASAYTYSIVEDPNAAGPLTAPDRLFLFADGVKLQELTKDGDRFYSENYIALQNSVNYSLNAAEDGSGTSYILDEAIGTTDAPDGDLVSNTSAIREGNGAISVARDQLYKVAFDFSLPQFSWNYYNLKLFHWNDWDTRDEFPMSYQHPNTFTITTAITGGHEMKFISPWDHDFGAEDPASLMGNLINKGGSNLTNIATDGTYTITITVTDDYQSGTYEYN